MEFNTPRHSRRIGRQLYLLDAPALHALMGTASIVTDLNYFEDSRLRIFLEQTSIRILYTI